MTLDRPIGTEVETHAPAPDVADRFSEVEPAKRLVVAVGLAVSILAHAVLIGFGVVKLESRSTIAPNLEAIPIVLVPDPRVTSSKKEQEAAPVPEPKPDPALQSKPAPAQSAPPKAPQTGAPPVSAPVDRALPSQAPVPPSAPGAPGQAASASGTVKTKLTNSELDALRAQIQRCWSLPQGWTDPKQVSVVVDFGMKIDGTVAGRPTVVEFPGSQYGVAAAKNAQRAVLQCGPYRLPADKYNDWREVQIRLTPGG